MIVAGATVAIIATGTGIPVTIIGLLRHVAIIDMDHPFILAGAHRFTAMSLHAHGFARRPTM